MSRQTKYPPELRERAIRMVYEQREHHESQWAAIESVAQKIGCTAQTLRNWIAKTGVRAFSTRRQKLSLSSRGLYCAIKHCQPTYTAVVSLKPVGTRENSDLLICIT